MSDGKFRYHPNDIYDGKYGNSPNDVAYHILAGVSALIILGVGCSLYEKTEESREKNAATKKRFEQLKKMDPGAKVKRSESEGGSLEADKETDSVAIKQIKEKYLFQITQYEQMLGRILIKQQQADATLLSAAQEGDLTKVQEALEIMGANINAQDAQTGNTAIMMAKEKQPFGKAFPIAKYLVAEPGYNPDVENKDGITFMDMMDAELSKGSAAWQSISRKSDMLKPDATRKRDNTEIDKAVAQLQQHYDSLMSTYGKEMKVALGYHATAKIGYYLKKVMNEDGTSTVYDDNSYEPSVLDKTGTLEFEKLNPQNIDFKELANVVTMQELEFKEENIQEAQQSVEKTRGYNQSLNRR